MLTRSFAIYKLCKIPELFNLSFYLETNKTLRKLFVLSVLTGKMETRSAFWVDNFSLNFVVDTHFDAFFFLKKLSMLCVPVFIFTSGGTHVVV